MKCGAVQIQSCAMAQTTDDVGLARPVERDGFILKILDESLFEFRILVALQQNIQRLDDDAAKPFIGGCGVVRQVNLSVAATSQALFDVEAAVESALE